MEKRGNAPEAISILEKALLSRPDEGPFYLALAQYYTEIGNPQKAADLTQKGDRKSTRLNSSHTVISYAVFCLKKKKKKKTTKPQTQTNTKHRPTHYND